MITLILKQEIGQALHNSEYLQLKQQQHNLQTEVHALIEAHILIEAQILTEVRILTEAQILTEAHCIMIISQCSGITTDLKRDSCTAKGAKLLSSFNNHD